MYIESGKSIMIFGAGINQLELINEASKLGIATVVIDPQNNPPGKDLANYFYVVSGNDYETTLKIALKHKISGIVTGQMEKPMRLMARLAKDLGLIFHTPEVLEKSLDKWLMKQEFIRHSIPCASGFLLKLSENTDAKNPYNYPLIIKPRDAYSSRGVYKVNSADELKCHLEETRSYASNGDVIIEEFLQGQELSIETITFRGKTSIIQFTEKFITPYPNTVELAHFQPAYLDSLTKEKVTSVIHRTIQAIGIDNSAAHTEIMLTKDGPKVIEIGARLGGDFIASHLARESTGVSMDRAAILVALGIEPDISSTLNQSSFIQYLNLPEGVKIRKILSISDITDLPEVVMLHINLKEGDIIPKITQSALRYGWVLIRGLSRKDVMKKALNINQLIRQRIILE
jgi:biotin carboxylase